MKFLILMSSGKKKEIGRLHLKSIYLRTGINADLMKSNYMRGIVFFVCLFVPVMMCAAQERVELIPFGNFETWLVREIKESFLLGGMEKTLHEPAPAEHIKGNKSYRRHAFSPWRTSNVMADVGVVKTSASVFPDTVEGGKCARLDTKIEKCKVLGFVNIEVLASGSLFLGEMDEPIKNTKEPMKKILPGISFERRPAALMLDYKFKAVDKEERVYMNGFSTVKKVPGRDSAEILLLLQKRWEDENGNVFAKRIGTLVRRLVYPDAEWKTAVRFPVVYGDITALPGYKSYMGLMNRERIYYCKNTKGNIVPIRETEWGEANDVPTHMIIFISSSCGGAYVGTVGNSLWVDNISLVYTE